MWQSTGVSIKVVDGTTLHKGVRQRSSLVEAGWTTDKTVLAFVTNLPSSVVVARLRGLTSARSPLNPLRVFDTTSAFYGTVDEREFALEVHVTRQTPVLVTLKGRLEPCDEGGTVVFVSAGIHPLSILIAAVLVILFGSARIDLAVGFVVGFVLIGSVVGYRDWRRGMRVLRDSLDLEPIRAKRRGRPETG